MVTNTVQVPFPVIMIIKSPAVRPLYLCQSPFVIIQKGVNISISVFLMPKVPLLVKKILTSGSCDITTAAIFQLQESGLPIDRFIHISGAPSKRYPLTISQIKGQQAFSCLPE